MFDDWKPDKDFGKKAALWGLTISEPVSNAELAEFIDYWKAEGKARHHVQWEQTLAKSLKRSRNHPQGGNHVRAGKRVGTESNFKGNAVEAVHAATAELRKKYGLDGNSQNDKDLGANGGALFGQVDETKRGDTVITLDKSNWKAV